LIKASRFAPVRVVAIEIPPTLFAIWIAARPTLLEAAVDNDCLAFGKLAQFDQGAISGKVLHPNRSGFGPGEVCWMLGHGMGRHDRGIPVNAIFVHGKCGNCAHCVADQKPGHTLADRLDLAGRS
jgi:hypothetical protein